MERDKGRINFHPIRINWSYLYLGMAARIIKKKKFINEILIKNQTNPGINPNDEIIGNHPPRNKLTMRMDVNKIAEYSPKKNNAKPIAEYSTL